jgi:formylglycine-generating enzyme required for sulfatase activity
MARIPAGEFMMGSDEGDEDEKPIHSVLVDEFSIAIVPVTQRQYVRFVRGRATVRPQSTSFRSSSATQGAIANASSAA